MTPLETTLAVIRKTRLYTKDMLQNVWAEDWFRQPAEGINHIAWIVGHLAIAEHALTMKRIRGPRREDADFLPESYATLFGKGSTPKADPSEYPSPEEILQVLDAVHQAAIREVAEFSDEVLAENVDPPHPMFRTKLEAIQWCPQHEMLHVGQIALLRRLFGQSALR
jgi:hypothetical protein